MNIWSDDWGEQGEDWSGGGALSKRLVPGGGPFLGASLYELGPGNLVMFPVHSPPGPAGAHGLRNDTAEPVRYVMAGTRVSPEVVEYPDLGQLTAQSREPSYKGEQLFVIHTLEDG